MVGSSDIPESSNFYCSLRTTLRKDQVAALFAAAGWQTRKCSFADFEVRCGWADLVIEGEERVLLHGAVANHVDNAPSIFSILQVASVPYDAELYGPDGSPLSVHHWGE